MTTHQLLPFCLTLRSHPERAEAVRELLRSGRVNWEELVWVSTSMLVHTAMYVNLERAGLLEELPDDLVEFLSKHTEAARERNRLTLSQIQEVTSLLNTHGISPIFTKGAAHHLSNLYEDPAERLMGDIDLLVQPDQVLKTWKVLKMNGYKEKNDPRTPTLTKAFIRQLETGQTSWWAERSYWGHHRHLPALYPEDKPCRVEVHRQVLRKPYDKHFNINHFGSRLVRTNLEGEAWVMAPEDQLLLVIMNGQINDRGWGYGFYSLRQSYDLMLMSHQINPLETIRHFGRWFPILNTGLARSAVLLGNPQEITWQNTHTTRLRLQKFDLERHYPRFFRFFYRWLSRGFRFFPWLIKKIMRGFRSVFSYIFALLKNYRLRT